MFQKIKELLFGRIPEEDARETYFSARWSQESVVVHGGEDIKSHKEFAVKS